tara:strand:+ start:10854 stop:11249 length:396 start_codon:yes stop_codon:yes gene_type:complete
MEDKNEGKLLCSICGEENDDVFHTLKCGHTFHYNCLYLSFKNMKNNNCPYCRSNKNTLPIISGIKKIHPLIHYGKIDYDMDYSNHTIQKCNHVLTRGKNKGVKCSKNCKLGYNYCTQHYKNYIKNDEQIIV